MLLGLVQAAPVTALGLSAGQAEGSAGDTFSVQRSQISETRCLIPASHFYEFTGKMPKAKWHQNWGAVARFEGLCRPCREGRGCLHAPDNRAGPGCGPDP